MLNDMNILILDLYVNNVVLEVELLCAQSYDQFTFCFSGMVI